MTALVTKYPAAAAAHLHVPGVGDGADAEEQQQRAEQLVQRPARDREVRARVGREDPRRLGDGAVHRAVVLVPGANIFTLVLLYFPAGSPDQRVPVDEEDQPRAGQRAQVLRRHVVRHLSVQ